MGKKKEKGKVAQTTTQTTTVPDTPDIIAARNSINNVDLRGGVKRFYGAMRHDLDNEYFEPELPESVKGRIKVGKAFNLKQQEGAALGNAASEEEQIKRGGYMSLAGLTAGSNTSGTMNGTSERTFSDPWGTGLQIAKLGIQGASM